MSTSVESEWIVGLYDAAANDGQEHKYDELKEIIKPDVKAALAEIDRDLDTEAELLIDAAVKPTRRRRRNSLKEQLEYLLDDAIPEDRAYADPILDWVVPLGTSDGLDKKLRYWEVEDFRRLVVTAYRQAAEQTAAAVELDRVAQRVIDTMTVRRAAFFGDLALPPAA